MDYEKELHAARCQNEINQLNAMRFQQAQQQYAATDTEKALGGCELLIHQLQRKQRNAESDQSKLARVLDILQRHPEFEEFMELLRSGLV